MNAPRPWQPPGYPPQCPPPGWGRLIINTGYNTMSVLLAATGPQVEVDGRVFSTVWGDCIVDVPPGPHHIAVHTRYMGQMGRAALTAVVHPGQQIPVFYRPPAVVGMAGGIGFQPQKTRGLAALLGVTGAVVLLFVLLLALSTLA